MPRGNNTADHPGRKVGRDRYAPKQTRASRAGDVYSVGGGPARTAFSMEVDNNGGVTGLSTGGPAGAMRRRGPRFSGQD